ncbi:hypothetical protein [Terriglobus sp.]|uniref:hypothetical protein n=1 Tax=Terriglobus sp. TaxID=1889013 RepID=UPI003B009A0E
MHRVLSLPFVVLAIAVVPAVRAQSAGVTTSTIPPQYGGVQTNVSGVFVTPIPNLPMTATVDLSSMRILPDGSTELRKTENHIARASNGSIYNERRILVGVSYQGLPRLLSSHVYDPQTRVSITWGPRSDVAQSITLSARQLTERKPFTLPVAGATDTDLGESTMSGVTVHGMRRTRTVSPGMSTMAKPGVITDEYWYSQDLHLIMLEKHDDPRTGEQIVTVLNVQRAEPPVQLFAPPSGYRVVDVTSTGTNSGENDPFAPPSASHAPVPTQTVNVR